MSASITFPYVCGVGGVGVVKIRKTRPLVKEYSTKTRKILMENAQTTVNERIKILANTLTNKTGEFLKATGLTSQNLSDLTAAKRSAPSFATITKILGAYPQVSERWLLFGDGPMLKGQQPEGAGLTSGEATVAESETLLKLAVTEAKLEASQAEIGRLYELLGKSPSSPDAAGRWFAPLAPLGQRSVAAYAC
jgi:hypothetical protein